MKRLGLMFISAILVAGGFVGGVALASGEGGEATAGAEATVGAQAPNVRLAAVLTGGVARGTFTLRRAKGVAEVTNPISGVFCIEPSGALTLSKVVPVVSLESSATPDFTSNVRWNMARTDCPPGHIEVVAFRENNSLNTGINENEVTFSIVVP